ncbi:hypothetical protein B7C51_14625 [Paenibacillus larvae subsp. pulvifaciens]|uniref:Mga helix-turn-helix domain-containing protein n=2 Tax=Paenibacillus larvae TaxID=1464 RepID=A0A1V0UU39_9BACL|nr:hypothetical protein B7C51_14625 [Paenibacillus larvae subsp. pulvifaciens]
MGPPQESNGYIKILGLIIFQNGANINEIMDKVHISRSTVYRQIDKIKEVIVKNVPHMFLCFNYLAGSCGKRRKVFNSRNSI